MSERTYKTVLVNANDISIRKAVIEKMQEGFNLEEIKYLPIVKKNLGDISNPKVLMIFFKENH